MVATDIIAAVTESLRNIKTRVDKIESQNTTALLPPDHHITHEPGGSDALSLLAPENFNPLYINGLAAVPSLRALGATGITAAAGNDSRFSDARAPTAHHVSHELGGTDEITHLRAQVPFYNVQDYGALGNGVTDDITAINAAFSAFQVTGGVMYFPAGTYVISAAIVLLAQANKKYTIRGLGNAVIAPNATVPEIVMFLGGVSSALLAMHDITIDRNPHATTTNTSGHGVYSQPVTAGTQGFIGMFFENVRVFGVGGNGFSIVNCWDVTFLNCVGAFNKTGGISIEAGANYLIAGGEFSYNVSSDGGSDYGIAIGASGSYSPTSHVTITGVAANYNGRKGIDAHNCQGFHVDNNTCIGNGASSIAGSPAGIYAVNEGTSKNVRDVVISNNLIDMAGASGSAAAGFGIQIGGYAGSALDSGSFIVSGNIIKNCDWNTGCSGILVNNADTGGVSPDKVIICDNTLENPCGASGWGINFDNFPIPVHLVTIHNNIMRFPSATQGGVRSTVAHRHNVCHNIFEFLSTFAYGIITATGPSVIIGNVIIGTAGTLPISVGNLTGSIIHSNIVNTALLADPLVRGALANGYRVVTGLNNVTVPISTRTGSQAISFGFTFPGGAPIVLACLQQGSAAGEMPASVIAISVTATGCTLQIDLFAAAAAARTISVAWQAIGI